MKPFLVILLFFTGCVTAEVVTSKGDIHVLRVDGDIVENVARADRAVAIRAAEICPNGWDLIAESAEPHGVTWTGGPAYRFERTIRCL